MALEQFGQKILVNGDLSRLQRFEFLSVVVDQDDLVTEIGEASAGHKSDVSGSDHRNGHGFSHVIHETYFISFCARDSRGSTQEAKPMQKWDCATLTSARDSGHRRDGCQFCRMWAGGGAVCQSSSWARWHWASSV